MAIITVSRGSYHRAKAVAEKLSVKLGYGCLSRDDVVADLGEFHLPEIKLVRDLHDAFSVLERFSNGKERFVASIRSAILDRLMDDNTIYHGLAGHHFLKTVSHVLKVRIVADIESRIEEEVKRAGITPREARHLLLKDDEERRKWCMLLYGIDIFDPVNYDLVIKVDPLTEDDAVGIIAAAANLPTFQTTDASRNRLTDMALAARVRDALFEFPSASVSASAGKVRVTLKAPDTQKETVKRRVESILEDVETAAACEVQVDTFY